MDWKPEPGMTYCANAEDCRLNCKRMHWIYSFGIQIPKLDYEPERKTHCPGYLPMDGTGQAPDCKSTANVGKVSNRLAPESGADLKAAVDGIAAETPCCTPPAFMPLTRYLELEAALRELVEAGRACAAYEVAMRNPVLWNCYCDESESFFAAITRAESLLENEAPDETP